MTRSLAVHRLFTNSHPDLMPRLVRPLVTAALLAATAHAAEAQTAPAPRPIELGIDGSVTFQLEEPHVTSVLLPFQRFRVGFFTSENVSVEPSLALNYFHVSGASQTGLTADLGLLYHFPAAPSGARFYLRPFGGLSLNASSGEGSDDTVTRFHLGGGLGVKIPLADRLRTRMEVNLEHGFKNDDVRSRNTLGLSAGFSFFTH
jgi:hypothetical protein